jgi:hypothetical protein
MLGKIKSAVLIIDLLRLVLEVVIWEFLQFFVNLFDWCIWIELFAFLLHASFNSLSFLEATLIYVWVGLDVDVSVRGLVFLDLTALITHF